MSNPALEVDNLVKRYGDVEAVRGVSFSVAEGEVFGLLGPNGAGKTTTIEILEGLRDPDGGRVRVCALDPQVSSQELKHEIGAALQSTSLPDKLRVIEALRLFAGFYKRHRDPEELLKRFGLEEKRTAYYAKLSGGQKQRLALAMALVNNPRVLFFDEPTAGLDPQVRREIYDIIEELRREKKTILMTTHYIEEAERLCDRVAIIDHGKVIALGTPREPVGHEDGRRARHASRIERALRRHHPHRSEARQARGKRHTQKSRRCGRRTRSRRQLRVAHPARSASHRLAREAPRGGRQRARQSRNRYPVP